jgi:Mrp family chromosome partitioning ATPase
MMEDPMVTRKDAAEVEIDPVQQTAIKSQPKLVVALGRGKTGKSTFIRWAAERAFRAGRTSVIADADRTNATLAAFFDNVSRPRRPSRTMSRNG